LRARRFAAVVRLEHTRQPDPWMLELLIEELGLSPDDVYGMPGPLDYTNLLPLADLPIPGLKYETWTPRIPPPLLDEELDFFTMIRRGDLLVHHPYESFSASVERFIRTAADDPRVLAIKMTLYRTGAGTATREPGTAKGGATALGDPDESPFINTLVRAAEAGKQVVCVVELKARFDEQRNIQCAQMLENAGVHVVYGVVGLKTHTKTALVVRREADGLRCYAHIGTGNYHAGTATLYTDLGLFTARPSYTRDVVELFHYLTGRSLKRDYEKLLVAPVNMRRKFMDMIAAEIEHHQAGRPAHIIAKMNSLEDRVLMDALYGASQHGVPIDLIVRGFCCMRPQARGLSDNIRVISIIGRFLEHSRIYYFRNGAAEPAAGRFFIGSADWMYRNLESRVEAVSPVEDHAACERLWHILQISLNDQRTAWDMMPDGTYIQRVPYADQSQDVLGTQEILMQHAATS
jgi:polyphosphate kinase